MDLCGEPDAMTHPEGMQIKVSRQELSRLVGCSREMAGRVLKVLEEQGLLRATGKTIVVFNARPKMKTRPVIVPAKTAAAGTGAASPPSPASMTWTTMTMMTTTISTTKTMNSSSARVRPGVETKEPAKEAGFFVVLDVRGPPPSRPAIEGFLALHTLRNVLAHRLDGSGVILRPQISPTPRQTCPRPQPRSHR